MKSNIKLYLGDCIDVMKKLDDNSIDSIVSDPPYELGFMGKSWDNTGITNSVEMWKECLRVLKPGGHLLAFSGTRTYHRMASAIEDAGFEIRDMIEWVYGSGFPKSLNIGKTVDKLQGNERVVIGSYKVPDIKGDAYGTMNEKQGGSYRNIEINNTKGISEYEGWGTALKPAHEPICMARKPLSEKSVAENCLKWGTGGINIDESRVGDNGGTAKGTFPNEDSNGIYGNGLNGACEIKDIGMGRFPANLIHDNNEEVRECFPDAKGASSQNNYSNGKIYRGQSLLESETKLEGHRDWYNDSGSAARFFKSIIYQAKANKTERNRGCENLKDNIDGGMTGTKDKTLLTGSGNVRNNVMKNNHPTVKPIALMEYLIKMITPKGGVVLDPFMGSGSTGCAAKKNRFGFIGIELCEEYIQIARERIKNANKEE